MSYVPTLEQAHDILNTYIKEPARLRHCEIVSAVMGYFALRLDAENEQFWRVTGLLHDLDIEMYPDEHCLQIQPMMQKLDLDPRMIRAVASHGYLNKVYDIKPEHIMEKILYTINEFCVLADGVAQRIPSKKCADVTIAMLAEHFAAGDVLSVFATGVVNRGLEMLQTTFENFARDVLEAMKAF